MTLALWWVSGILAALALTAQRPGLIPLKPEYGVDADPVKQAAGFAPLISGAPLETISANRLDYISGRTIEDGVPRDRFALVAEGRSAPFKVEYYEVTGFTELRLDIQRK